MRRLCLRCRLPLSGKSPYHYACKKAAEAELRAKIEAPPSKEMTEEETRRLFEPEAY